MGRGNNSGGSRELKSGAGFTLIELIVTIGVIGVLVGSLVILIDPATQLRRGRDAARKSDLSLIRSALEFYRSDIGSYPPEDGGGGITEGGASDVIVCDVELTGGTPPNTYMTKIPCDPNNPTSTYFYDNGGSTSVYTIWACLENIEDKDRDDVDGGANDLCPASGRVSYTLINP